MDYKNVSDSDLNNLNTPPANKGNQSTSPKLIEVIVNSGNNLKHKEIKLDYCRL